MTDWFRVPVVFEVAASTQAGAKRFAKAFATDRIASEMDFRDDPPLELIGPAERRGPSPSWMFRAAFVLDGADGENTRAGVITACENASTGTAVVHVVEKPRKIPDPGLLSPSCRGVFRDAAGILLDELASDLDYLRSGGHARDTAALSRHLPPQSADLYDGALVRRWIAAVERVAKKLIRYPDTYLASTAEELAAHALIDEARLVVDWQLEMDELDETEAAAVLKMIDEVHDLGFEDHDVLMLFDSNLAQAAQDEDIVRQMGIANLELDDWFKPFRPYRS